MQSLPYGNIRHESGGVETIGKQPFQLEGTTLWHTGTPEAVAATCSIWLQQQRQSLEQYPGLSKSLALSSAQACSLFARGQSLRQISAIQSFEYVRHTTCMALLLQHTSLHVESVCTHTCYQTIHSSRGLHGRLTSPHTLLHCSHFFQLFRQFPAHLARRHQHTRCNAVHTLY